MPPPLLTVNVIGDPRLRNPNPLGTELINLPNLVARTTSRPLLRLPIIDPASDLGLAPRQRIEDPKWILSTGVKLPYPG